ncbi:MAG: 3-isopropylmalate dehydratase small subunit [Flammeovirgaceae bacterium]|nr:3-isopropylmalate dehydratase small subunit [Marinoscillum sp.]MAR64727.1 3-isopropylmalate dehydratase small subunit [Flammeovirgaceae bacterium]OUX26338.1 MAG: 3-isopropylmalate dehydratase small subunit [Flammeovirgaceae bacterium TMED262]|tara:strand:- start:1464 stop:2054 length:591 start_codon:yes stop_codon:yes gene_type:complete
MDKFNKTTSIITPLDIENVDTDQIIPARFLKSVSRDGFGENLFRDWRYDSNGELNKDFILNTFPNHSKILLAGRNFGCGSSREHAAWAIYDYGFRVVISSFFADIFKNNALNNGLLVFELDEKIIKKIFKKISLDSNLEFTIDLIEQKFYSDDGSIEEGFEINEYNKTCLLNGFDNIDYLLSIKDRILKYENETGR